MRSITGWRVVLIAFLTLFCGATSSLAKEPKSLSQRVATAMAEGLLSHGFRAQNPRARGRLGLTGAWNDVSGDLRYGDDRSFKIPVYKYDRGAKTWRRDGTFEGKRRAPRLGFNVRVYDQGKGPASLAGMAQARKEATSTRKVFNPSSGISRKQERTTSERRFEGTRRAGAKIERLVTLSTPHSDPLARVGRKAYYAAVSPLGPEDVRVTITYPIGPAHRQQGKAQAVVVTFRLTTGPGLMRPAQYVEAMHIEGIALSAIASSLGGATPEPTPDKVPPVVRPQIPERPVPAPEDPGPEPTMPVSPAQAAPTDGPVKLRPRGGYGEIADLLTALQALNRDLTSVRVILRAGKVALDDQRKLQADIRDVARVLGPNHKDAAFYRTWLVEIHDDIVELEDERRRLIAQVSSEFEDLISDAEIATSFQPVDEEMQAELKVLHAQLGTRKKLVIAELLLAAGEHRKLASHLRPLLADRNAGQAAFELKVLSLVDQAKPAAALKLAQDGLRKYRGNETLTYMRRTLEVGFLRALAAKATDRRAKLNAAWEAHTSGVSEGRTWQAIFGSLKGTWQNVTGKAARLARIHATQVDRLTMTHNGIELMQRLRRAGLSFQQIRDLGPDQIRQRLHEMAPNMGKRSDQDYEAMELSLDVAFESEDVKRLLSGAGAFTPDLKNTLFSGAEEFEETWMEWGADLISAKNVALMFLPLARASGTGHVGRFVQWIGGSQAGSAGGTAAKNAPTIQQWFYARPAISKITARLAQSRAGHVLHEGRHVLRALRYDAALPVRMGTAATGFAGQMAAGWILFQGMGDVGEQLGGELGRTAGQLAASLVGIPGAGATAKLQARWTRSLKASQAARAAWTQHKAVLKTLRAPIIQTVAAKPIGPTPTRQVLEEAAATAEQLARRVRGQATKTGSRLLNHVAEEADALAASARASLRGNPQRAATVAGLSQKIAAEADDLARELQKQGDRLSKAPAPVSGARTLPPQAKRPVGAQAPLENAVAGLSSGRVAPGSAAARGSAKSALAGLPSNSSVGYLESLAHEAMREGRFLDAAKLLNVARQKAGAQGYSDVISRVERAYQDALSATRAARQMQHAQAKASTKAAAEVADAAKQTFTARERQVLQKATFDSTKELPGAGKAREIMDAAGRSVAVWKPAGRKGGIFGLDQDGQLVTELLMSRLGRALGLRVPHVEPMMLDGRMGLVVKWIPHSKDLSDLAPGARAAFKKKIAEFRALQVLMGNYDLHAGNFKVDRAGNVWAIDAGQAGLTTPKLSAAAVAAGHGFGSESLKTSNKVMNWTRYIRDFYSELARVGYTEMGDVHRLELLLQYKDMAGTARKIRQMSKLDLARTIKEVLKGATESRAHAEEIFKTLNARREVIEQLLSERWKLN